MHELCGYGELQQRRCRPLGKYLAESREAMCENERKGTREWARAHLAWQGGASAWKGNLRDVKMVEGNERGESQSGVVTSLKRPASARCFACSTHCAM